MGRNQGAVQGRTHAAPRAEAVRAAEGAPLNGREPPMSWGTLDPYVRDLAEQHCTEKELIALKLWHNGAGYRRIGVILGISMSTARGRVHRAIDRIVVVLSKEENAQGPGDVDRLADSLREPPRQAA